MHKNAQKVEWKTQSKISCQYTWLLHCKNCPSRWRFLRSFLTPSKPIRRSITTAKKKEKEKKESRKKKFKIEKPKDIGHFLFQKHFPTVQVDFSACPSQIVIKRDARGKNGKLSWCKCIFDQIKANLAEIRPENRQNVQKTSFLQKAPGVNELNKDSWQPLVQRVSYFSLTSCLLQILLKSLSLLLVFSYLQSFSPCTYMFTWFSSNVSRFKLLYTRLMRLPL